MKKKVTLSVALATFNEEKNVERCLNSVKNLADEIVVVDGGSTDETVSRAKNYTHAILVTDNPPIFHINKQKAIEKCTGRWILQLDADEEITPALAEEIRSIIHDKNAHHGYFIARRNFFSNQWMKKGGMYPDYVIRLFRNGKGYFPCKSVHEQIVIDGTLGYLKEPMNHFPYASFQEYLRKAGTYTSLTAQELKKKKTPISLVSDMTYIVVKPFYTFIMLFIRHRGFMDGWRGFQWALFSGLHHAQAYLKYKKMTVILVGILYVLLFASPSYASDYMLPYPSYMPGNKLYRIDDWWDRLQKYWYFGDMGGLKYHRTMADKYVIEAKTLFEYQQYKLAVNALQKSDQHFADAYVYLIDVKNEHKDDGEQGELLRQSSEKHTQLIDDLSESLPDKVTWQEEQKDAEDIRLDMIFTKAKTVRNYANQ
ncbi:MAG: glycosyltransferase family 2 protein [Candidatus Roizmanbacteria bacterium]|nr:glycosyltransferase family 2 protein [Candidatus Roizmanbacteria bacterium]